MTTRLHVVRVRRRPPLLWWAIGAAVVVLAWLLELWLLVLGCAAAAITLIRFRRWHRRTVLPAIVAGAAAVRAPARARPLQWRSPPPSGWRCFAEDGRSGSGEPSSWWAPWRKTPGRRTSPSAASRRPKQSSAKAAFSA